LSASNTPPTSHAQEVEDSNQSSIPYTTLPIVPETREFLPHVSVQRMAHHLPQLTLPTFNGELMSWPTFWDSFSSAVHNNDHLPEVQKFAYLKSLLYDEAARTVEGFTLSNANYQQAISLLEQRYGRKQKITYMSNLLQLPSPAANITDLRFFYDRLETNIRGLEALGEANFTCVKRKDVGRNRSK